MVGNGRARGSRRAAVTAVTVLAAGWVASPAEASGYVPVAIAGSTWAENAVSAWAAGDAASGLEVSYAGVGTTAGFQAFDSAAVDGAVLDQQFADGSFAAASARSHTLVPLAAGTVAFAYRIRSASGQVTGLKLSPSLIAKIFSRTVTTWNDPLIAAENPGTVLPALAIVPVVRADSAGTSDVVGRWLARTAPADWDRVCQAAGLAAGCAPGPSFPGNQGDMILSGAANTVNYVMQSYGNGAITFVESSYAEAAGAPTALVENATGTYQAPTDGDGAVALQSASVDPTTGAVDLDRAAASLDPRAYPVLTVSYLMAPTAPDTEFTLDKGTALRAFASSAVCLQQDIVARLGFVPLTGNVLDGALGALNRVPESPSGPTVPQNCADSGDTLAGSVPMPGGGPPGGPAVETLGTVLPAGALMISVSGNYLAVLPSPVLDDSGTVLRTSGEMTPWRVTDTRAGAPGWTLSGQVSDFSDGAGHGIDAGFLSWKPHVVGATGTTGIVAGPVVGAGTGGLKTPRVLATGTGLGSAEVGAELELDAPTTTVAGTYAAMLTVTAI